MLQLLARAITLKKQQEKTTLQVFFIHSSGTFSTFLLPYTLLTTAAKKKTLFVHIHVSLHGIVGFTAQWTAFMHA